MMPSEILREIVSKRINIDLNQYAWSEDLKNFVLGIELDDMYEDFVFNMSDVYEHGFNIGHCGLTSRYLVRNIEDSDLIRGIFPGLIGTKRSEKGGHAWVMKKGFVIDTTLMIMLPINKAKEIGYQFERQVARSSAKILSEYELFSHEYRHFKRDYPEYAVGLYRIAERKIECK